MISQLWWIAGGATTLMVLLWLLQMRTRDAGVVDAGWALGLAAAALFAGVTGTGAHESRAFAGIAGGLWGLRLGVHLLRDRIIGKPEDGRYQAMRAAMGSWVQTGFLLFFLFQAGLIVLFAVPFTVIAADAAPSPFFLLIAAVIWCVGLTIETIADTQLARFRRDPSTAGTTCRRGLWRWSRHPNYFGEWLLWWSWPIAGLTTMHGPWLWAYPALMFLFVRYLTGIPFTEMRALAHRPDYAAYQRSTSMLIPWFPRSNS